MKKNSTYYSILGIKKDASKDDIKSAYRKMAKKYHPDHNKDAAASAKFNEATEAYNVLMDDNKKFEYDNYGRVGSGSDNFQTYSAGNIWDFLNNIGSSGSFSYRHHTVPLTLSLEEAALGCKKSISYNVKSACAFCGGAGGTKVKCDACSGTGMKGYGYCNKCRGQRFLIGSKCNNCMGVGSVTANHDLSVAIPPGIKHGEKITIHKSNNEVLVGQINIQPHPRFERIIKHSDADLLCYVNIDIVTACLGGEIEIEDLYGKTVTTQVRPGIQNGEAVMLAGHGMPVEHSSPYKGNLYVAISIDIPTSLSNEAKELIEQLRGKL